MAKQKSKKPYLGIIIIVLLILILSITSIYTYKTIFQFDTYTLNKPILQEITKAPEYTQQNLLQTPLSTLPQNFETTTKDLPLIQEDRTKLLQYALTYINTQTQNNTLNPQEQYYSYKEKPILLNTQMLTYFFLDQTQNIENEIINTYLNKDLKEILNTIQTKLTILKLIPNTNNQTTINKLQDTINKTLANNSYNQKIEQINDIQEEEKTFLTNIAGKYNLLPNIERLNTIHTLLNIPPILQSQENNTNTFENLITKENQNELMYKNTKNTEKIIKDVNLSVNPTSIALDSNIEIYIDTNFKYLEELLTKTTYTKNQLNQLQISSEILNTLILKLQNLYTFAQKQDKGEDLSTQDKENITTIINMLPTIATNNTSIKTIHLLQIIQYKNSSILTISPELLNTDPTYEIEIDNNNFDKDYEYTPITQSKGSVRIPVLMYHQIDELPSSGSTFVTGLYVSPSSFEKQLAYLVEHNYNVINTEQFLQYLNKGENPSQKTVMLTFDDGTKSQYQNGYPILKKYGLKGVFFIPSHRSGINVEQMKEMSDNGMDIQSHSSTHKNLQVINDTSILNTEIAGSKSALQYVTGKSVISIAYPGCVADTEAFSIVAGSGYKLGFSCGKLIDHYNTKKLSLHRIHVFDDMESFKKLLSGIN